MKEIKTVAVLKYCTECQKWEWHTQVLGHRPVCLVCWLAVKERRA